MEPNINGLAGLYSPTTGITDYKQITQVMSELFLARGGVIDYGERLVSGKETTSHVTVNTNLRSFDVGRVISCAGLHSDRLIRSFSQTPGFRVVPFRGEYFRILNQSDNLVKHLIYPVPDPERPFLGVHLTRKISVYCRPVALKR